ncbi:hypothetical protein PHLGIDRAFT_122793 [Phlebiopsis gigantea 11061_1 CR5-6]|uniref:Uncharacterized protein n=1 Tax=Phlebiopsis gigantea (strain 11061_1 CR5-6) TaxID=745531 RepID=A0A0C3S2W7_PHLG1|nr:hypothetical protein PHLGIDRAFT_122793 [Phlebiopsis gigantea 11061_1 CR5-6]
MPAASPAQHHQIPLHGGAQSTAPGAQLPTLANTHIRSVADAQKLFYAVQLGLLPKVERRLDAVERKRLQPGDVYVWEERGSGPGFVAQGAAVAAAAAHKAEGSEGAAQGYEVGIERWTEGLSWSASRIRDDFLIYFENIKKKERGVDRDGARARSLENQVLREGERDMYIKQTYSVLRNDVNHDDGAGPSSAGGEKKEGKKKPRKWHLNAYFTKSTEGDLNTIDSIPWLRDIQVPDAIFTSARQSKKGNSAAANASSSASAPAAGPSHTKAEPQPEDDPARLAGSKRGRGREGPSVQRTYAPFPVAVIF